MAIRLVGRVAYLAFVCFVAWALKEYVGFTLKQALALSFAAITLLDWGQEVTRRLEATPYTLQIKINHDAIRAALGLTSAGLPSGEHAEFVIVSRGVCIRADTGQPQYLAT